MANLQVSYLSDVSIILEFYHSIDLSIYEFTIDLQNSYFPSYSKEDYIRSLIYGMTNNGYLDKIGKTREDIKEIVERIYQDYERTMMEGPHQAPDSKLRNGNYIYAFLKSRITYT